MRDQDGWGLNMSIPGIIKHESALQRCIPLKTPHF